MIGASVGILGTARAQYHLRQCFVFLNMYPINAPEVFIRECASKFDAQGNLTDDAAKKLIQQLLANLVAHAKKMKAA
jgi:chromate reductase